jgi:RNA polymerase sigma factor (sigma-70 family)
MRPSSSLADRDLLVAVRAGDHDAYGELWSRHAEAIRKSVTFFTNFDADDVTAETFTRVLRSIENGNGPVDAFRPYAMVTARNIATEWSRTQTDLPLDAAEDLPDDSLADHMSALDDDRSLAASAFRSLPSRWQEVLWYTEVEQMKPAEVAPLLGMSANNVAVLTGRAREGLRQAWITAHVRSDNVPAEHKWFIERAAKYARNKLPARQRRLVSEHLEACPNCRLAFEEIENASSRLALVLLPLVLGGAGTAYALWAAENGSTATVVAAAGGVGSGPASGATRSVRRRVASAAVAGVAAVALVAGAGYAAIQAEEPSPAIAAPAPPARDAGPSTSSTAVAEQTPPTDDAHPPATEDDASTPPQPARADDLVDTPLASSAVSVPAESTQPPAGPVDPPSAPDEGQATPLEAPAFQVSTLRTYLLPRIVGTASPQATVTLTTTLADGTELLDTATADDVGSWSVIPEIPAPGSYTLTAVQSVTADGTTRESAASAPVTGTFTDDLSIRYWVPVDQPDTYRLDVTDTSGDTGNVVQLVYSDGSSDALTFDSGPTVALSVPRTAPAGGSVLVGMYYVGEESRGLYQDLSPLYG